MTNIQYRMSKWINFDIQYSIFDLPAGIGRYSSFAFSLPQIEIESVPFCNVF